MPGVFWLGGGCGAGKTTVARVLTRRLDLRLYPVDAYTYEHARRAAAGDFPVSAALAAMPAQERWQRPPAELTAAFVAAAAERLALIRADVAALGPGPTIVVEGPQLFPDLIAPVLASAGHGCWLLPAPDFGRRGVVRRGGSFLTAAELARRHERDVLLTRLNRDQAVRRALSVIEVSDVTPLSRVLESVEAALTDLPGGLVRAAGAQRQQIRQAENAVVVRQLHAWQADIGPERMPQPPVFAFACECQRPGCEAVVTLPLPRYEERAAGGPVEAPHGDGG